MATKATPLLMVGRLSGRKLGETGPRVSHPLAGQLRLVYVAVVAVFKRASRSVQGLLRPQLGIGMKAFVLHSVAQSKSRG